MTLTPNRQQELLNMKGNSLCQSTNQNVLMENPAYPTVSYDQGGESNYDTVRGALDS